MFTKPIIAAAAAALLFAAGQAPAAAAYGGETVRIHVPLSDLNLATDAGQRAMHRRIHRAAEDACGPSAGDLRSDARQRDCVATKIETALTDATGQQGRSAGGK